MKSKQLLLFACMSITDNDKESKPQCESKEQ